MGWRRASQSLKSPVTETNSAFGAQTAKRTPGDAFDLDEVRAEGVPGILERAFAVEVQIEFRDDGREAVGIFDHGCSAVPVLDLDAIGVRVRHGNTAV